jgi:hypothetical protein
MGIYYKELSEIGNFMYILIAMEDKKFELNLNFMFVCTMYIYAIVFKWIAESSNYTSMLVNYAAIYFYLTADKH